MGGPREVSPAVDFTFYEGIQLPGTVGARWGNHHPAKNSCPAWNSLSRDCLVLRASRSCYSTVRTYSTVSQLQYSNMFLSLDSSLSTSSNEWLKCENGISSSRVAGFDIFHERRTTTSCSHNHLDEFSARNPTSDLSQNRAWATPTPLPILTCFLMARGDAHDPTRSCTECLPLRA